MQFVWGRKSSPSSGTFLIWTKGTPKEATLQHYVPLWSAWSKTYASPHTVSGPKCGANIRNEDHKKHSREQGAPKQCGIHLTSSNNVVCYLTSGPSISRVSNLQQLKWIKRRFVLARGNCGSKLRNIPHNKGLFYIHTALGDDTLVWWATTLRAYIHLPWNGIERSMSWEQVAWSIIACVGRDCHWMSHNIRMEIDIAMWMHHCNEAYGLWNLNTGLAEMYSMWHLWNYIKNMKQDVLCIWLEWILSRSAGLRVPLDRAGYVLTIKPHKAWSDTQSGSFPHLLSYSLPLLCLGIRIPDAICIN